MASVSERPSARRAERFVLLMRPTSDSRSESTPEASRSSSFGSSFGFSPSCTTALATMRSRSEATFFCMSARKSSASASLTVPFARFFFVSAMREVSTTRRHHVEPHRSRSAHRVGGVREALRVDLHVELEVLLFVLAESRRLFVDRLPPLLDEASLDRLDRIVRLRRLVDPLACTIDESTDLRADLGDLAPPVELRRTNDAPT